MSRAKRIIKLSEQGAGIPTDLELDQILDGWVTHWSGNQIEYVCPTLPEGRLQVFDFGSWHWLVNGAVVNSGSDYQSLAEFLRDEFGLSLEKVGKEEKGKKTKNENLKEQAISYDEFKMKEVVDNFVRFLVGNPKIALKNLEKVGNPGVKGLEAGEDYHIMFRDMFTGFMKTITRNLG
jgi:hypothetical protein